MLIKLPVIENDHSCDLKTIGAEWLMSILQQTLIHFFLLKWQKNYSMAHVLNISKNSTMFHLMLPLSHHIIFNYQYFIIITNIIIYIITIVCILS